MIKLECPYCHNEMDEGFIESPARRMMFSKEQHFSMLTDQCINDGEVMLAKTKFNNVMVPAHICRNCKKIIIDY